MKKILKDFINSKNSIKMIKSSKKNNYTKPNYQVNP